MLKARDVWIGGGSCWEKKKKESGAIGAIHDSRGGAFHAMA